MIRFSRRLSNFLFGLILISTSATAWGLEALLSASNSFPAPLGTSIRITAAASDTGDGGVIWYRFRVRPPGGDFRMIRDFGPEADLDWTGWEREGTYEIEVTTRNVDSGETAASILLADMSSRVNGSNPTVSATTHPLVFLYSAPPCRAGEHMRVQFQGPDGVVRETPSKSCDPAFSTNFYLAGLYEKTEYRARHIVQGESQVTSPEVVSFTTGEAAGNLYPAAVVQAALPSASNQILLSNGSGAPTATDLNGAIVWYVTGIPFITRTDQDGYFWTIVEGDGQSRNIIRKFDLTGTTVLETNTARVNEQLRAMGKREISGFHHEAVTLPDGRIAALAGVEQILTDVQGPGPVDVLGDMIVVLDSDLNVVWTWDAFDHLDVRRVAINRETCTPTSSGCAQTYLADLANDWTHGNSIQPTPDGHLLYSTRHQDWLVKINYSNGTGDGSVVWRLGKDGDFQIISNDPSPWFSHQHDGSFDPWDPTSLLVFDNGNTRILNSNGLGNSRGQALKLDEVNRTATLTLNADLGVVSLAVGSAQRLSNGNYSFDAGFVSGPNGLRAFSIEVDPNGKIVYNAAINNLSYRSFRMTDMYTPK